MVQTQIAQYATEKINSQYNIDSQIKKVAIGIDGSVILKGVNVNDDHKNNLAKVERLHTNILDFKKLIDGKLYFGSTELENLHLHIRTYKNDTLSNLDKFIAVFDDGKPGSGKFFMSIKNIEVTDGAFSVRNDNNENPIAVYFKKLNGAVENFQVQGPNIKGDITALSMDTQWGLFVQKMQTKFSMTKRSMDLQSLNFETPNSNIKGSISMRYPEGGLKDFTEKVNMIVNFQQSKIATQDLQKFYKEFSDNQILYLKAIAKGTLNTFKVYNALLQTSNNAEYIGQVSLENLFDKTQTFRVFTSFDRLQISRKQAIDILPKILSNSIPAEVDKMGVINAFGKVSYANFAVNADVNVQSQIGKANAVFSMSDVNNKQQAKYTGDVLLEQFQLGKMLNNNDIGEVSTQLFVHGKGFTTESLQTTVSGQITQANFRGYTYSDITLDGELKVPYYKGYVSSKDPNALIDFDGVIDLSQKKPRFNFVTEIHHLDLSKIKIIKDSVGVLKGKLELNGTGKSLEEFEGKLAVQEAFYSNNKDTYSFDNFEMYSEKLEDNTRKISVNSPDILDGYIQGKFQFNQIKAIIENALGSLYTHYKPNPLASGQFVNFDFVINNKIIEIFAPSIQISENTNLKGKIIADEGDFKLQFSSPYVNVDNNKIKNISVQVDNKNPLFNAYVQIDTINVSGYDITDLNLINVTQNDTLFVRTEFRGGKESRDFFNLNLYHTIEEENHSVIGIQKSEVNFKDYLWYLNENDTNQNRIVFNKKMDNFEIEPITLSHNGQQVTLQGNINGKNKKDLKLEFSQVDLAKITPDLGEVTFGGLLNGMVSFIQENDIFKPKSNLVIEELELNNVALGELHFNVEGDKDLQKFKIDANIINDFTENMYARGEVDIANKQNKLNLDVGLNKFNLATISPFLSSVFKGIRGDTSGRITVLGTLEKPKVAGRLHLNNAGMRPVFTGVDYAFEENAIIDVTESQFILKNVNITDTKHKTKGIINGNIYHNKFKNWQLDTRLTSENLLALDIDYIEGTPYYGTAFIDGFVEVKGPIENLNVLIQATSNPGTKIKIPLDDTGSVGDNNYVHFITPEEKANRQKGIISSTKNNFNGVQMDFEFNITPDAEIEILLDRDTGHGMKGKGYGFITMEINTLGRFNMWGDFIVYNGEYNFKYEGIIDKKLDVKRYGTIRWDGEVLNAILDLEAIYKTQANPGVILESSELNRKVDTEVSVILNGNLASPEIDFKIDFPNVTSVIKSEIEYKLADKDTRQTQAMALLATGSFLSALNADTAVYGSLFERASSLFDDLFSDEDGKFKVGLNYTQRDRNKYAQQDAARVGVTLSTQISDKILINGKLGVPVGGAEDNVIVGDVEVQLLLNEDGTLRARVFNKENNINYLGEGIGYTQGAGLSYEVDFNTFKELLQKIFINAEKRANKKAQEQQKNNTPKSEPYLPDDDYGVEYLRFQERREEKENEESE